MMCGMMRPRPNAGMRREVPIAPACSVGMMGGQPGEGGVVIGYALPMLPVAFGLAVTGTMLVALMTGVAAGGRVPAILAVPVLLAAVLAVLVTRGRSVRTQAPLAPDEGLRARYALGVITRQQYQDALVESLKDRYVRGTIGLEEYERGVARVYSWKGTAGERSTTGGTKR